MEHGILGNKFLYIKNIKKDYKKIPFVIKKTRQKSQFQV